MKRVPASTFLISCFLFFIFHSIFSGRKLAVVVGSHLAHISVWRSVSFNTRMKLQPSTWPPSGAVVT